ncbi:hypothetical protein C8F04DRAFT_1242106 [Mycena alexandri]|uniref:Uncharacterized protein n=1 Tax=Mycena alexandri TaxID=1745969 RepID=A0AAD6S391_9AGAR|nr:hypothetical protein C8F04DRAFT_1242106 [Mycena alexandri]
MPGGVNTYSDGNVLNAARYNLGTQPAAPRMGSIYRTCLASLRFHPRRGWISPLFLVYARGGGGIPPPSPGYDCGVRGWIPPPTFPLRERGGISPSTFLYPSAGESHRHLSFERTRLGPTANFPLGAGGRMSPPSSFYACTGESHCRILFYACAAGSHRHTSFARPRLDPAAISSFAPARHGRSDLAAITLVYARADGSHRHSLVYSCAGGYHCHLFIFACAGGSHRRPSLTCAQRDLTADSPLRACGGISPQTLVNIYPVGAVVEYSGCTRVQNTGTIVIWGHASRQKLDAYKVRFLVGGDLAQAVVYILFR